MFAAHTVTNDSDGDGDEVKELRLHGLLNDHTNRHPVSDGDEDDLAAIPSGTT